MPPQGIARKGTSTPSTTLRKQSHVVAHPNSRTNALPIARKSAHPQRAAHIVHDSTGTRALPPPLITSRPYTIAGVAGFHRGTKPPTRSSQIERRLKPVPHKNVSDSRIDHGTKIVRETNAPSRLLDGTAAKSLVRRRAVAQATSSRKRDLLDLHRSRVDSAVYAETVFRRSLLNKHNLAAQSSSEDEKPVPKSTNDFTLGRPTVVDDNDVAWRTMIAAFGALSLSTATPAKKNRLPFLRRIVRTGFLRRCKMMGLAVDSASPQTQPLTIIYKLPIDDSGNEWDNEVTEYMVHEVKLAVDQIVCPLCDTLGRIITREVLEAHLKWDHLEVEASWQKRKDGSWELVLELPGDEVLLDEYEEEAESSRSSPVDPSLRLWSPVSSASPVSETDLEERQTRETATSRGSPVPAFKLKREFSPAPVSRTASLVPESYSIYQTQSALDPLGPQPSSVRDDMDVSCRPCGPRLFDLIARDPSMPDCGLTSWSLLERDEELFEIDDMRDEDKAMQALWNRWIFSERRRYLLDPQNNVKKFVEKFQSTIKKTAGWKGVRVWLLLLAKHKYLTGDDVVAVMRHYETVAGIAS